MNWGKRIQINKGIPSQESEQFLASFPSWSCVPQHLALMMTDTSFSILSPARSLAMVFVE